MAEGIKLRPKSPQTVHRRVGGPAEGGRGPSPDILAACFTAPPSHTEAHLKQLLRFVADLSAASSADPVHLRPYTPEGLSRGGPRRGQRSHQFRIIHR